MVFGSFLFFTFLFGVTFSSRSSSYFMKSLVFYDKSKAKRIFAEGEETKIAIYDYPFTPNAPFLYPLKRSNNRKVFWCFQGVEKGEKGCIRSKSE